MSNDPNCMTGSVFDEDVAQFANHFELEQLAFEAKRESWPCWSVVMAFIRMNYVSKLGRGPEVEQFTK